MGPPYYSDNCYISIVRNADKLIKCYIPDISEGYKSAFLKYRHMGHRNFLLHAEACNSCRELPLKEPADDNT